jgi:hypothetical protein
VLENTRQNNHNDYVFDEYDYVWSMSGVILMIDPLISRKRKEIHKYSSIRTIPNQIKSELHKGSITISDAMKS